MAARSLLALWVLVAACTDYGVNIIEYPEPSPPDSEPPFVDTQQEDTQPPVDTQPPPSCEDGPWPDGEASVDESCIREPVTGTFRPVVEWWISDFGDGYSDGLANTAAPTVGQVTDDDGDGDVDSDDIPDIAVVAWRLGVPDFLGTLRLVSGDGSALHWSVRDAELDGVVWHPFGLSGASMADADGDGDVELAVIVYGGEGQGANADYYTCYPGLFDHSGALLWVNDEAEVDCGGHAPAWADLEGDGIVELILGRLVLDPITGEVRAEGEWGWGYDPEYGNSGFHSFAIDIDGEGSQEIITGNSIYDPDGELLCFTGYDDGYPAVADLDGDGLGELVTTGNGWVRIFEHDCWIVDQWQLFDGGAGGPATIADYDGDGEPEIGVASYGIYYVYEVDGTLLWSRATQDHSSSSTGSAVYDFDGDGYAEVVYADEEDLWIYAGTDGAVRMRDPTHESGTINEYPVIVDVDGDGEVEIVVGDNNGLFVVGDYDHSWVAGRQVWNQASYNIVNVNDDLTIPAVPEPSWPAHNNFRSGDITRAFASALPDPFPMLVDLCSLECEAGVLQLSVQVGNAGLGAVEGPLAVAVYAGREPIGDPLVTRTPVVSIPSGQASETLTFRLEVGELELEALTVLVDDGGVLLDCHQDNNTLVIEEGLCP
jgi:hypothetical protein